jgi:hypothetical protein
MRLATLAATFAASLAAGAGAANATVYVVDAKANSSTGGVGLDSITLMAGEAFTVSSSTDDLWTAEVGSNTRTSDGDGLVATRFASPTDDSGFPPGSLIEEPFPNWVENGFSAPYASLVGQINGVYEELGANFSGTAWATGTLTLFFWDENNFDNGGNIAFDIETPIASGGGVPEPASWALMILGFGLTGASVRARRQVGATA